MSSANIAKEASKPNTNPPPPRVEFSIQQYAKWLSFVVAFGSCFVFKQVNNFIEDPSFDTVRQGRPIELLWGFAYAAILAVIYETIVRCLHPHMNKLLRTDKYTEPVARNKRCYTFAQFFYQTPYYFLASLGSYLVLTSIGHMPPALGGSLDPMVAYQSMPFGCTGTFWMRQLYLIQLGEHLRSLIKHCFFKADDAKYYEFVLHHSLTVLLIVVSFLTNAWEQGVLIMFLHDLSDGLIKIVRFYIDYKNKKDTPLAAFFIFGLAAWIYLRIYVFVTCCILPMAARVSVVMAQPTLASLVLPYSLILLMLASLEVLHIYWTYLFIRFIFMKQAKRMNVVS